MEPTPDLEDNGAITPISTALGQIFLALTPPISEPD